MVECPKCGSNVGSARKIWKMAGRPDRTGKRTQLTIGLFDCPQCKTQFRFVFEARTLRKDFEKITRVQKLINDATSDVSELFTLVKNQVSE